jgi:hypothetical protein
MTENRKTAQGSKLKAESKNLKAEGTRQKARAAPPQLNGLRIQRDRLEALGALTLKDRCA